MRKIFIRLILRLEYFLGLDKDISSGIRDEIKNPDREIINIINICSILEEEVKETDWIEKIISNRLAGIIISLGNQRSGKDRLLITKNPDELADELNKKVIREDKIERGINGFKYKKQAPLVIWSLKCGDKIKELIQLATITNSI